MSENIPARFRKTKTEKWAVMAPVDDLEKALASDGKVDVLKKSGDWSSFTVGSLGKPFDVDGVQMCYGYAPGDESDPTAASERGAPSGAAPNGGRRGRPAPDAPPVDTSEPLPEYQGGPEDEWGDGF